VPFIRSVCKKKATHRGLLYGQCLSSFRTATSQYAAAVFGSHARAETVNLFALANVRTESRFHDHTPYTSFYLKDKHIPIDNTPHHYSGYKSTLQGKLHLKEQNGNLNVAHLSAASCGKLFRQQPPFSTKHAHPYPQSTTLLLNLIVLCALCG
jgi:hypothetical protein